MIEKIGSWVVKRRWIVITFWLVSTALVFVIAPSLSDLADYSSQGFLPDTAPSKRADKLLSEITVYRTGASTLILVIHRSDGLTPLDEAEAARLAVELQSRQGEADDIGIQSIVHPWMGEAYKKQLIDPSGRTAMIVIGMSKPSWDAHMPAKVKNLRQIVDVAFDREGLEAWITGEAAFSIDEHTIVKNSMDLITAVTVVIVLIVLSLVLRSPLAPLLPLSVIGLSYLMSRGLIAFMSMAGFAVSSYTETFLIAVLFGAGTDYCLLMVGRYRDELAAGHAHDKALKKAHRWSSESILSSGMTTLIGFVGMAFAAFGLYNSTGPAVAVGVALAIVMVLTLTPAIISVLGPRIFWPTTPAAKKPMIVWPRIAAFVSRRPVLVLALTLAVFIPPSIASLMMTRSFDQVSEIPPSADSRAGFDAISEAFGTGLVMPVKLVIKSDKNLWGLNALPVLENLSAKIADMAGVALVRGPTRPTGIRVDRLDPQGELLVPDPTINVAEDGSTSVKNLRLPTIAIAAQPELKSAMEMFISPDGTSCYLDIMLKEAPYITSSLDFSLGLKGEVSTFLVGTFLEGAVIEVGGPTAMFADVREFTGTDFALVMVIVLGGVFLVLVVLLKSLIAPLYLLATILVSFVSTMGLSYLLFQVILGYEGVNWAVQFFAFCVLVALGVDYNIFLMARVKEEMQAFDTKQAVERALMSTGKIITSCGIIMAGCFCAMLISPMLAIQEVGFATVVGLLLDTFIIRSFMVPSLATILGEKQWWPGRRQA